MDENVGGAIRSEICEFDIISISLIWILVDAPRRIFSFSRAGNPAYFRLAARVIHIDIATNFRRVRQPSLYQDAAVDLQEILEVVRNLRGAASSAPIGDTACLCAEPGFEVVRELELVWQRVKSIKIKIGGTKMLWNRVVMFLPSSEPQFTMH